MPLSRLTQADLRARDLGPCAVRSPLALATRPGDGRPQFVHPGAGVALDVEYVGGDPAATPRVVERAGPREQLFFDPSRVRAGIVTAGGLCPGMNNVIRSIVLELHHGYGVRSIRGFRYGYEGLLPGVGVEPSALGPEQVRSIHKLGGSVLGLSRARHDAAALVDALVERGIDILFTIGGDGTLRGAHALAEEIARRDLRIAVVGVPKTIDNDILYVDKTFGFDTAVEVARVAIDAAHVEAVGARNGIGLVKLMGRDSGFIAAAATLASDDVNVCLVPEVPFELEGDAGLLAFLERRLASRSHAVIVVAEGCGPSAERDRDPGGAITNVRHADVGPYLRTAIEAHFAKARTPITLKYIDPSYMIRSVPANASDSILCDALGRNAVHAAMVGKTDILIGRIHGLFTHVPLAVATRERKCIDPEGTYWLSVEESTGQPPLRSALPVHAGARPFGGGRNT